MNLPSTISSSTVIRFFHGQNQKHLDFKCLCKKIKATKWQKIKNKIIKCNCLSRTWNNKTMIMITIMTMIMMIMMVTITVLTTTTTTPCFPGDHSTSQNHIHFMSLGSILYIYSTTHSDSYAFISLSTCFEELLKQAFREIWINALIN